jgi:hypothetical protein
LMQVVQKSSKAEISVLVHQYSLNSPCFSMIFKSIVYICVFLEKKKDYCQINQS